MKIDSKFAFQMKSFLIIILACLLPTSLWAQDDTRTRVNPEDMEVDMDNPTFVPMVKVGKVLVGKDSIQIGRAHV